MQANGAVALHGSYLRRRGAALAAQFYRVERGEPSHASSLCLKVHLKLIKATAGKCSQRYTSWHLYMWWTAQQLDHSRLATAGSAHSCTHDQRHRGAIDGGYMERVWEVSLNHVRVRVQSVALRL